MDLPKFEDTFAECNDTSRKEIREKLRGYQPYLRAFLDLFEINNKANALRPCIEKVLTGNYQSDLAKGDMQKKKKHPNEIAVALQDSAEEAMLLLYYYFREIKRTKRHELLKKVIDNGSLEKETKKNKAKKNTTSDSKKNTKENNYEHEANYKLLMLESEEEYIPENRKKQLQKEKEKEVKKFNPKITQALTCLEEAKIQNYFDVIDEIIDQFSFDEQVQYNEFKAEFISGNFPYNFSQRLYVFARKINDLLPKN